MVERPSRHASSRCGCHPADAVGPALDISADAGKLWRVDQPARQQIRLILDDASDRLNSAVAGKIEALRRTHAALGMLQSGNTIVASVGIIDECTAQYIANTVDKVSAVAKDMEAFAMIAENVEVALNVMSRRVTDLVDRTFGAPGSVFGEMGHRKAALARFHEARDRLRRQLELHRFTFTEPYRPKTSAVIAEVPLAVAEKPKGGKPLAAHWDDMWAAMAVALYSGDFEPATQADIERAMADWLAARHLDAAASTIRARAQKLWRELRKFQEAK